MLKIALFTAAGLVSFSRVASAQCIAFELQPGVPVFVDPEGKQPWRGRLAESTIALAEISNGGDTKSTMESPARVKLDNHIPQKVAACLEENMATRNEAGLVPLFIEVGRSGSSSIWWRGWLKPEGLLKFKFPSSGADMGYQNARANTALMHQALLDEQEHRRLLERIRILEDTVLKHARTEHAPDAPK
jgi:hypothetical protein